jgi:D-threo-aldose 1-dehydrogenase
VVKSLLAMGSSSRYFGKKAQVMQKRKIGRTGIEVDVLGIGTAPLGGNFAELDRSDAAEIFETAQRGGISFADTAPFYGFGRSERVTGDLLRGKPYVLSTKVGRLLAPGPAANPMDYGMIDPLPFHPVYDYSYDGVMRSFDASLHRLGLDRIDILLAHDIGEMQHGVADNARHFADLATGGYKALEELRASGRVSAIGLGVNENEVCLSALEIGQWDVFLLAGRYTLLEQTALDELFPKCRAAGTSIICGGPFNSGILAGGQMWNYAKAPLDVIARVEKLQAIAAEYNVPLSAAALQFPLGNALVSSVIPGTRSAAEFDEILGWASLSIPEEFWKALQDQGLLHQEAPIPQGNPYQ